MIIITTIVIVIKIEEKLCHIIELFKNWIGRFGSANDSQQQQQQQWANAEDACIL